MARERDDDRPRPVRRARPVRDDDYEVVEERPRRRRDEDYDDDYEDEDELNERERRRRKNRGDATGGLIPYKNGKALAAYYCGVFSLIPFAGVLLGPIAVILGVLGLMHKKKYPKSRGTGHAIAGIVLGILAIPWTVAFVIFLDLV